MNKFNGLRVEGIEYFSNEGKEGVVIAWAGNRGNKIRDKEIYEFGEYSIIYNTDSKEYYGDSERMDFDSKEFLQYLLDQIDIEEGSLEKGIHFLLKIKENFDRLKVIN